MSHLVVDRLTDVFCFIPVSLTHSYFDVINSPNPPLHGFAQLVLFTQTWGMNSAERCENKHICSAVACCFTVDKSSFDRLIVTKVRTVFVDNLGIMCRCICVGLFSRWNPRQTPWRILTKPNALLFIYGTLKTAGNLVHIPETQSHFKCHQAVQRLRIDS